MGQAAHEVAASSAEYDPAAQGRQSDEPLRALNAPMAQAVHVPPSAPLYPGLHTHLARSPLPASEFEWAGHSTHATPPDTSEYKPAGHCTHADEPFSGLYVPIAHAVHIPPSGPVWPLSHVQALTVLLPGGELEWFDGHARQTVPAFDGRYDPASHLTHADDPFTPLKVPTSHKAQLPPSVPVYPALQRQSCAAELAASELEKMDWHARHATPADASKKNPASQSLQVPDPLRGLKDPGLQAVHTPPSDPSYPTLQIQSLFASLPGNECVFDGHSKHAEPPVAFEYLPASQPPHIPDPLVGL